MGNTNWDMVYMAVMKWIASPPNSYVKTLSPVTSERNYMFGDKAFQEVTELKWDH